MKLLTLMPKFSGCHYHRCYLPSLFMPKEYGRITDKIDDDDLKDYDIVFINRSWEGNDLFTLRERYGFKIVVDMDDYWILSHDHYMYDTYNEYQYPSKLVENMRRADLVTCTHERLADKIRPYNANVVVLSNAIPYGHEQFNGERFATDAVKLFWAGGISHEQDLKILEAPLKLIDGNVQMVMGGFADSNETERYYWHRMASYFTNERKLPYTLFRGASVYEYYGMFKNADVCLIPLVKNHFNGLKSNLKILEAAGKGVPVIVSKCDPYLGFPDDIVNYAASTKDWVKHIKRLSTDKDLRDAQGVALLDYCLKHYNFKAINEQRKEAFLSLLK